MILLEYSQVYENGRNEGEQVIYFNLKEASKGVNDNKALIRERVTKYSFIFSLKSMLDTVLCKI